jgi:hypothetical protein
MLIPILSMTIRTLRICYSYPSYFYRYSTVLGKCENLSDYAVGTLVRHCDLTSLNIGELRRVEYPVSTL